MSFIFPRTITIRRTAVSTAVGALPYQGRTEANEADVAGAVDLPASIQSKSRSRTMGESLPSDPKNWPRWQIIIPKRSAGLGLIQQGDIVVDDLGVRYQVVAPYWNSLGYQLDCEMLAV